jgi:RNA polymerase sigma factor (TIGR02999 family)
MVDPTLDPADRPAHGARLALDRGVPPARLLPNIYVELRELAHRMFRRERGDHTLEPTALVHEAWLKLADQDGVEWSGRSHLLALGAQAMRRILVDHARARRRDKRGGDRQPVALTEELAREGEEEPGLLDLEAALRKLERLDRRQAKVVELRFFGGLAVREVAELLGVSVRTVEAEWTAAKAWMRRELESQAQRGSPADRGPSGG